MKSGDKFSNLFRVNSDPSFLINPDGEFEDANSAFCEKVGCERKEIMGLSINDAHFFPENVKENIQNRIEGEQDTRGSAPLTLKAKADGEKRELGRTLNFKIDQKDSQKFLFICPKAGGKKPEKVDYKDALFNQSRTALLTSIFAEQDYKASDTVIPHIYQSGLGIPDRDYYIDNNKRMKEIRSNYGHNLDDGFRFTVEDGDSDERE